MGNFVISKRIDGHFQFNLKADNHQVILTSQGYTTKDSCENGIESVRVNSQSLLGFPSDRPRSEFSVFCLDNQSPYHGYFYGLRSPSQPLL